MDPRLLAMNIGFLFSTLMALGLSILVFVRNPRKLLSAGDAPVLIDTKKFSYAVDILIENAITYTRGGGKIQIYLEKNPRYVTLSGKDNGIGIPKSEHRMIFSSFFRGRQGLAKQTGNTTCVVLAMRE